MAHRRIGRGLTVVAAVAAGLGATAPAAHAAGDSDYALNARNSSGSTCFGDVYSHGSTMNHQTRKDIWVETDSASYGCTLELYTSSTSTSYVPVVAQPGGLATSYTAYYPVHRIRLCQSGNPGSCSAFFWWDFTTH